MDAYLGPFSYLQPLYWKILVLLFPPPLHYCLLVTTTTAMQA
jgi:hypothetical protein